MSYRTKKKKKERLLKRWYNEFNIIAGIKWTRTAKIKSECKKLGEAYALNRPGTI